jgi:hypothetical protein
MLSGFNAARDNVKEFSRRVNTARTFEQTSRETATTNTTVRLCFDDTDRHTSQ